MNSPATARVTLTVEVSGVGSWGRDCKLDQIYQQAAEAAVGRLRNSNMTNVRIIGEPVVTAVLVQETK